MKWFLLVTLSIGLPTTSSINAGLFPSKTAGASAQELSFVREDSFQQGGYTIWYGYNRGLDDPDQIIGYACPNGYDKATVTFTCQKAKQDRYNLAIMGVGDEFFASITLSVDHRIVEFEVQPARHSNLFFVLLPTDYKDADVRTAITNNKPPHADFLKILLEQAVVTRLMDYTNSVLPRD